LCDLGTDCDDCRDAGAENGVRMFCFDCPEDCRKMNRNIPSEKRAEQACFEFQWHDGTCHTSCNNRECNYDGGDCSQTQIKAQCEQVVVADDYTLPPTTTVEKLRRAGFQEGQSCDFENPTYKGECAMDAALQGLTPVSLQMNIAPPRVLIHSEFSEMMSMLEMDYTLQWEDQRLFLHPCFGALQSMMSMNQEAAKSDNARYEKSKVVNQFWNVKIDADGLVPGFKTFDELAEIHIDRRANWTAGIEPFYGHPNLANLTAVTNDPGYTVPKGKAERFVGSCEFCVTRHAEVELQVSQSGFDFFYYPFDTQVLRVTLQVDNAYIFTCDSITAIQIMEGFNRSLESMESMLLPFTGEWKFVNGQVKSVRMMHNLNPDGTPQYDTCNFELTIGRVWLVYFVKTMLTTIVVVIGSVYTALFLHPEDHLGDRAAVLFIAFLILVTNMQMDLGLGIVTSLMWLDMFNVIQCCMVFVALGESIYVHVLLKTQRDMLAISIDRVCRNTIPLMLYPIVTLTTILWGMEQSFLCPDVGDLEICGKGRTEDVFRQRSRTYPDGLAALGVGGTLLTILLTYYWIHKRYVGVDKEQHAAIATLVTSATAERSVRTKNASVAAQNEAEQVRIKATWRVFNAFDLDDGGSIDFTELRGVLSKLYPSASPALVRDAMFQMRPYADAEGELDLPSFQDAIAVLMDYMAAKYADGQREAALPKTPRAGNLGLSEIIGAVQVGCDSVCKKELKRQTTSMRLAAGAVGIKDAFMTNRRVQSALTNRRVQSALGVMGKIKVYRVRVNRTSKEDVTSPSVDDAPACSSSVSSKERPSLGSGWQRARSQGNLSAALKKKSMTQTDSSTEAASVMLRTTNGGWYCGQLSGVNVPPEVMCMLPDMTAPKAEQEEVLAASVITALLAAGFTLASQCTLAANNSSQAPPEIAFTLIKPGRLVTKMLKSSESFPIGHTGASTTPQVRKEKEELMDKFGIGGRVFL